jgi:L-amino acid N-acyltransferase YncA
MNGTDIHVREATEADIPRVLEIYRSSGIDDTEYAADDRILAVWKRMKSYPDYRVYVAETEGTVCGTFALLVKIGRAHV